MTPTRRRPATPASQGPARTAPDVPIVAPDGAGAETNDGAQLLGPEGEPITEDAPRAEAPQADAGGHAALPATAGSPRRPISLYPLPVWPD